MHAQGVQQQTVQNRSHCDWVCLGLHEAMKKLRPCLSYWKGQDPPVNMRTNTNRSTGCKIPFQEFQPNGHCKNE